MLQMHWNAPEFPFKGSSAGSSLLITRHYRVMVELSAVLMRLVRGSYFDFISWMHRSRGVVVGQSAKSPFLRISTLLTPRVRTPDVAQHC